MRGLGWWLLAWGVAGSLAIGLAAVQLLPTLELVTFTTRASTAAAGFDESHDLTFRTMPELARRLLSLVGPRHFSGNPWETTGNLGVLWAAAAVLALGLCRRPVVWLYGATLLLMLLVAFGNSTPVYGWLCKVVPGLSLFRNQTRVLLLAGFPLGMLAGHVTLVEDPRARVAVGAHERIGPAELERSSGETSRGPYHYTGPPRKRTDITQNAKTRQCFVDCRLDSR